MVLENCVEPAFLKDGARKLRTLFSRFFSKSWEFRGLRSLTLNDARMTELPDSICRLKHLGYLDVSRTDIKALPKSITKIKIIVKLSVDCFPSLWQR